MCCTRFAEIQDGKIAILAPWHNFVGLYLRSWGMYQQSERNLNTDTSCTCPHCELRPTNGWDLLASLGHPCKFQRLSRLGSVTTRHSSSGRQPNFAALNRRHHLHSAGRPARWALAYILVVNIFCENQRLVWYVSLLCTQVAWADKLISQKLDVVYSRLIFSLLLL